MSYKSQIFRSTYQFQSSHRIWLSLVEIRFQIPILLPRGNQPSALEPTGIQIVTGYGKNVRVRWLHMPPGPQFFDKSLFDRSSDKVIRNVGRGSPRRRECMCSGHRKAEASLSRRALEDCHPFAGSLYRLSRGQWMRLMGLLESANGRIGDGTMM